MKQSRVMNTWQVLKYGLTLTADGYRQLITINRFLKPLVLKHEINLNYHLSKEEKKKVLFYYPMYTVLACAQMYVTLKGRKLTKNETLRLTLIGAMATLCDDLIDEEHWKKAEIFSLLSNVNEKELSKKAQLLLSLNKELQNFWPLTDRYLSVLKLALEWQSHSAKQLEENISLDEIVDICRKKNGYTSLMFASLVDEDWTKEELDFVYQSAIVGQLTNDSFDIYFDTQNNIHTYFNTASSIQQVRNFFMHECRQLHELVFKCNASSKNKINTIRRMSILHAFTLTALDHLQETENKYGAPVDWKIIPRKEMVTDMALNKNRFKTLRYMKWLSETNVKR
ncbi:MAG: hypothetical protein JWN76_1231 [Chitinophagaceae bacterium]|nr:hypothetical protein [Chitinophagaceae bacterium]